ncbi:MAG: signal peptidase II [Clostridia bacterium]
MALMIGVGLVALLLDTLTKLAAAYALHGTVVVFRGLLELRLTRNTGMALGILSDNAVANCVLPIVVMVCGYLVLRKYHMTAFTYGATGLVVGGFLGNFIQRLLNGYVLDMIYFPFMPWFVCNVADVAICAGVVMLGVSLLLRPKDWRERDAANHQDCAK